jgi:phosphoribosylformylglycinamidine (FGAM) synthase-like enzyme/phosphoribosylformylglycinamidine (FGAM) synthase-like amidotransferase family enzyme
MKRIFVEKKAAHNAEARHLMHDLRESLGLPGLQRVRVVQRYDIEGLSEEEFNDAASHVLTEPQVDASTRSLELGENEHAFAVEYLPGQFDQRADSAAQCIQILTGKERPTVYSAKVIVLEGSLSADEIASVKAYVINAVDSHEVPVAAVCNRQAPCAPPDVAILTGFTTHPPATIRAELGLAMSAADVAFCQTYFRDDEMRDPSITEIRMLDTYWSDHCRHTTFLTKIHDVTFDEGTEPIQRAWQTYLTTRQHLGREDKPITLMDIALIGMRELRASGELDNLEVSEEVNAACIVVPVAISDFKSQISNPDSGISNFKSQIQHPPSHFGALGDLAVQSSSTTEDWLVMFKNETHNHPTEIEPFGGAATCLGGCIRDPLSGRAYVYQAMRVTGAGNPLTPFPETLPGKLPQKKICQIAARGYSSYGNQIGLATGQVAEIYHPGYVAKRLEIGAVVAAAPRSQVFRGTPAPGDVILLIGGRTGRDGVGGATGSSKEHTITALENSAEVQKGDAPTERKIQRLFRNPELARKIKICNDFGAGGVSVAIGEIAPSLEINLDAVPKKYDGLDGTELAISESQERMAVCVDPSEIDHFIRAADQENLECVHVANVTDNGRLVMHWRGKTIVNLSRAFLDTHGVQQTARVHVSNTGVPPLSENRSLAPHPLTPGLQYHHERKPNLLERSPQSILRKSLGATGERAADVLRGVHRANEKAGIPVPTTKTGRYELARALRTVEEQQIRRCLSDLFLDSNPFNKDWLAAGSLGGAEQKVFPESDGLHFIKANNGSYHGHWLQFFERLHWHGILFPDAAYTFIGFIDDDDSLAVIIRQQTVPALISADGNPIGASRALVEAHMARLGAFRFRNDDYYLPAQDLLIEDLHDENVILGTDGETLRFIDPVIYQRPADLPVPQNPVAGASCSRPCPECPAPSLAAHLADLNICSQKGLGELFDGSVGAGTVLWPFGGKHQLTPPDAMVAKLPLLVGETDVCTYMSWGFDPYLSEKSPFHGAVYAVTVAVCKAVAAGARLTDIRLTLQEYFPKLGTDPRRWGLPFAALLGAFHAQHSLRLAAIGGKDSMSGSFNELDVPPTLVAFALAPGLASLALSPEFKQVGSTVSLIDIPRDADHLPDFDALKQVAAQLHQLNTQGIISALHHIGRCGLAAALAKMALGNGIGFVVADSIRQALSPNLFTERHCAFLIEHTDPLPSSLNAQVIGHTTAEPVLTCSGESCSLTELRAAWTATLEPVYPTKPELSPQSPMGLISPIGPIGPIGPIVSRYKTTRPKVVIPAFPGTNSEYDSAKAFMNAGADADILVFRNLTANHIAESLTALTTAIRCSQILMLPGGFSAGDEPDGSAKFIATIIRSPRVADAIMDLLHNRDGLILGICNGFQALIKTGLVPYGRIGVPPVSENGLPACSLHDPASRPTLVHNDIGRHVSCYVNTSVVNTHSPWLANTRVGDIHSVPISHGEGKFFASAEIIAQLASNGQIATRYCDANGIPSMDIRINPNGSLDAIEGITSPCGRVFGKMAHSERVGTHVAKNIPGTKYQPIFEAGVAYFG